MKISKPVIKKFKGVPMYISWFVIFTTKAPIIRTRALTLKNGINGQGTKQISAAFQILDIGSFFDASCMYLAMLDKKFGITKKSELKNV